MHFGGEISQQSGEDRVNLIVCNYMIIIKNHKQIVAQVIEFLNYVWQNLSAVQFFTVLQEWCETLRHVIIGITEGCQKIPYEQIRVIVSFIDRIPYGFQLVMQDPLRNKGGFARTGLAHN